MPLHVCNGATLTCAFGVAPSTMVVLPIHRMITSNQPAANINDYLPMVNIMSFGMCSSPANPAVIAATAAALGTPTPAPCVPMTTSPWTPGAIAQPVNLDGVPALDDISVLMCTWAGVISVSYAGQSTEKIS